MKKVLLCIGVLVTGWVAWYALSPLWNTKVVDDALPVSSQPATESPSTAPLTLTDPSTQPKVETTISDPVPIIDTPLHPATGVVRVVKTGSETVVRYENYQTINGPDVRVYLANDLKAKDFIDLGPIKGTEGNINYPVPAGINIDDYRYVLTWCEDFDVLFNSADLSTVR